MNISCEQCVCLFKVEGAEISLKSYDAALHSDANETHLEAIFVAQLIVIGLSRIQVQETEAYCSTVIPGDLDAGMLASSIRRACLLYRWRQRCRRNVTSLPV